MKRYRFTVRCNWGLPDCSRNFTAEIITPEVADFSVALSFAEDQAREIFTKPDDTELIKAECEEGETWREIPLTVDAEMWLKEDEPLFEEPKTAMTEPDENDKTPKERGVRDQDIVKWRLSPEQIAQAFENGDRPNMKTYGLIGIYLLGIYFHLELIEVKKATRQDHLKTGCREGELLAVDDEHQSTLDAMQSAMDCTFEVAEIDDRTYAIYMTPWEA